MFSPGGKAARYVSRLNNVTFLMVYFLQRLS